MRGLKRACVGVLCGMGRFSACFVLVFGLESIGGWCEIKLFSVWNHPAVGLKAIWVF